jgi:hypothetical protein
MSQPETGAPLDAPGTACAYLTPPIKDLIAPLDSGHVTMPPCESSMLPTAGDADGKGVGSWLRS